MFVGGLPGLAVVLPTAAGRERTSAMMMEG